MLGGASADHAFRHRGANVSPHPRTGVLYHAALFDHLTAADAAPDLPDVIAAFNGRLGSPGCGDGMRWYYGFDGQAPTGAIDLFTVTLHELAHALGFSDFTDRDTGDLPTDGQGVVMPGVFSLFLYDALTGLHWSEMTSQQRLTSRQASGRLLWDGPAVKATSTRLATGSTCVGAGGRMRMYAPAEFEPGSSVSHWDTSCTPNLLMEPVFTARGFLDITTSLLADVGWRVTGTCSDAVIHEGEQCDTDISGVGGVRPCTALCTANPGAGFCGDGAIGTGELCDLGADNGAASRCCSSACQPVAAGTPCGSILAEACRLPIACTGRSGVCPGPDVATGPRPDGTACSGGYCRSGSCVAGPAPDGSAPTDATAPRDGPADRPAPIDARPADAAPAGDASPNRLPLRPRRWLLLPPARPLCQSRPRPAGHRPARARAPDRPPPRAPAVNRRAAPIGYHAAMSPAPSRRLSSIRALALALTVASLLPAAARAAGPAANVTVDWPAFLARHDLVWRRPPTRWEEGAFLGNGLLGAMAFAPEPRRLAFQLGRTDVTDHQTGRGPTWPARACPSGGSRCTPPGDAHRRRGPAVALGRRVARHPPHRAGHPRRPQLRPRRAAGAGHRAIAHRRRARRPGCLPARRSPSTNGCWSARCRSARPTSTQPPSSRSAAPCACRCSAAAPAASGPWPGRSRPCRAAAACSWSASPTPSPTPRPAPPPATRPPAAVAAAAALGPDRLRRSHQAYWHAYYPQSFLTVPHPRIESFYWIQMYKLASATRADRPAIDTMGPWYDRTPWPRIWWNLNIQLTYWPIYTANRLALGESMLAIIDRNKANLRDNVPPALRADAMAVGRMGGPDAVSPVTYTGPRGPKTEPTSSATWCGPCTTLAALAPQLDEGLRAAALSPCSGAASTTSCTAWSPATTAACTCRRPSRPSTPRPRPTPTTTCPCCAGAADLARSTGARPDPRAPRWRDTLARLTPYPVGAHRLPHRPRSAARSLAPALLPPDDGLPARAETGATPADRALIERSLAHWIGFEGALQGYSFVGASAISSLMGKGDDAARYLDDLMSRFVKPNTMYREAGPVIETPLAAAQAVHEMLLQSSGGVLRIFPADPRRLERRRLPRPARRGRLPGQRRPPGRAHHPGAGQEPGRPARHPACRPRPRRSRGHRRPRPNPRRPATRRHLEAVIGPRRERPPAGPWCYGGSKGDRPAAARPCDGQPLRAAVAEGIPCTSFVHVFRARLSCTSFVHVFRARARARET